ncbi:MAG: porin [Gammaproteobacteria bacterium]|nr:porin [Gammaproteobacteria bacterium]
MRTTQKIFPLSLLLSCLIPGVAAAEAQLFGQANLSIASLDDDVGDSTAIDSHSSRVGIEGDIDSKSSVQIGYRFVWQIDMSDNAASSADHIKSREQYISLKDSWGEFRIGRHDTPYKKAGKKNVEFFSDSYADWNNIITKDHDKRADSSLSYYNTLNNLKLSVMYAGGEDTPAGNNLGKIVSAGAEMKVDDLAFALAFQDIDATGTALKFVVGYTLGKTRLGLAAENIDPDAGSSTINTMFSAKHQLDDSNTIKFTYGVAENPVGSNDPTMIALGIDHKLSDAASVFAYWADGSDDGLEADAGLVGDSTVLALGVIVKF